MVRESHKKFMDKYPYFLDKNKGSNFFRTSDVNNRSVQRLYNELFRIYESFHLSKRLSIWREQSEDYNYKMHFVANYPLIKEVAIYKNDDLIYYQEYTAEEEKNNFIYTYRCNYTKHNIVPLTVYKCDKCGEIYFTREPIEICDKCSTKKFTQQKTYKCSECDEIYFTTQEELHDCTQNNHTNTLEKIQVYKCLQCDTLIFSKDQPSTCTNCFIEDYEDKSTYHITYTSETLPTEEKEIIIYEITEDTEDQIEHIYLNEKNNWNATIKLPPSENYILKDTQNNIITDYLLTKEENTPTPSELTMQHPEYENDERITCTDNRNTYTYKEFTDSLEKRYIFQIAKQDTDVTINIINNITKEIEETITLSDTNRFKAKSKILPSYDEFNNLIRYDFDYDDNYDIYIHEENINNTEEAEDNDEEKVFNTEIPIIPTDLFRMEVTTYEEYYLVKGYPENDESYYETKINKYPSIYDHDQSLDEIGRLNNIPRKKYNIITDPLLYPYTEPPYNNRASEDDYHYMNRMINYNLRLWASINNLPFDNYEDNEEYLNRIGIKSKQYYDELKFNSELFIQRYNPVSLELWKIYGLESELINRERYILKVFDENLHPFDEETGLVKCWTPLAWEHKDRFCDYDKTSKAYFFVTTSNVRPLINEPVTFYFNLMNSRGVTVEEDYIVDIYKLTQNNKVENGYSWELLNTTPIHENYYNISPNYLNHNPLIANGNITHFRCNAYNNTTNEEISEVYISIIVRDWSNADWYVDENANWDEEQEEIIEDYIGDGTKDYPFLTLDEAVENVNINNDLVCILSDVHLTEPIVVNEDTKIVGKEENNNLPTIIQTGNRVFTNPFSGNKYTFNKLDTRFFSIVGGKSCKLTLSNLILSVGEVNSKIRIQRWENKNKNLNILESVVIRGGGVNLTITTDTYNGIYYPYDFIKFDFLLTSKRDESDVLSNQKIIIKYKEKYVATVVTDNNGTASYTFNVNEDKLDEYSFTFKNSSDVFFQSQQTNVVSVTDVPSYEYPVADGDATFTGTDYTDGDEINIYCNIGGLVDTVTVENGIVEREFTNISPNKYVLYTTHNNQLNGKVRDELIIETKVDITTSVLMGETLIKDLTVDTDNDEYRFEYDTVTVTSNTKLQDLEGLLIDFYYDDEDEIVVDTFSVDVNRMDATDILYSEAVLLKKAIKESSFSIDANGDLVFETVGDFFLNE